LSSSPRPPTAISAYSDHEVSTATGWRVNVSVVVLMRAALAAKVRPVASPNQRAAPVPAARRPSQVRMTTAEVIVPTATAAGMRSALVATSEAGVATTRKVARLTIRAAAQSNSRHAGRRRSIQ
jgi:hypothetical protein